MLESDRRGVAVVLSGGGINGVLLELAFLRRLSETALWPRVGWIYGTSAGALARARLRAHGRRSRGTTGSWREKVGRGPGRRSDPMPR